MAFQDPAAQHSTVDFDDLDAVPPPSVVPEPNLFPNLTTEAAPQMMEQRTLDPDGVVLNLVRGDEEDRHAFSDYSKKFFTLSRSPSPSLSIVIPLSFANSTRSSFCLGVSLAGMCSLIFTI